MRGPDEKSGVAHADQRGVVGLAAASMELIRLAGFGYYFLTLCSITSAAPAKLGNSLQLRVPRCASTSGTAKSAEFLLAKMFSTLPRSPRYKSTHANMTESCVWNESCSRTRMERRITSLDKGITSAHSRMRETTLSSPAASVSTLSASAAATASEVWDKFGKFWERLSCRISLRNFSRVALRSLRRRIRVSKGLEQCAAAISVAWVNADRCVALEFDAEEFNSVQWFHSSTRDSRDDFLMS
jgi:hypothetical protein